MAAWYSSSSWKWRLCRARQRQTTLFSHLPWKPFPEVPISYELAVALYTYIIWLSRINDSLSGDICKSKMQKSPTLYLSLEMSAHSYIGFLWKQKPNTTSIFPKRKCQFWVFFFFFSAGHVSEKQRKHYLFICREPVSVVGLLAWKFSASCGISWCCVMDRVPMAAILWRCLLVFLRNPKYLQAEEGWKILSWYLVCTLMLITECLCIKWWFVNVNVLDRSYTILLHLQCFSMALAHMFNCNLTTCR